LYFFIVGNEKCGTSALAEWIVSNGWAKYLGGRKGIKEPNILTTSDFQLPWVDPDHHVLDASTGYALNSVALSRLPQKRCKVIFCIRNAFHRAWSSYKFKKLISMGEGSFLRTVPDSMVTNSHEPEDLLSLLCKAQATHYPPKVRSKIREYCHKEYADIRDTNFIERCNYELDFFLSYRFFPIVNVLEGSFYTYPIRNIVEFVDLENFTIISVSELSKPKKMSKFINANFGKIENVGPLPEVLRTTEFDIGEAKPDFSCSSFDNLRRMFASDYRNFMGELERAQIDPSLIDQNKLVEFL
jgi:hypothetical protein